MSTDAWAAVTASPLFGLVATLGAFALAERAYVASREFPLLHPVLVSVVAIVSFLNVTHTPYAAYMRGGGFIAFLLVPATVALAVPLYRNLASVRRSAVAVGVAVVAGSVTAAVSGVLIARALGASDLIVRSIAAKSVTTPIAMGISAEIGGVPSLTAAFVILTGIFTAVIAGWVVGPVPDPRSAGLGIGIAGHGIGTARALALNLVAGAFSGLGLGLNAIASAIAIPLLAHGLRW